MHTCAGKVWTSYREKERKYMDCDNLYYENKKEAEDAANWINAYKDIKYTGDTQELRDRLVRFCPHVAQTCVNGYVHSLSGERCICWRMARIEERNQYYADRAATWGEQWSIVWQCVMPCCSYGK